MASGGYKVISLKGINLEVGVPVKIKGIHNEIESTKKCLMLEKIVIENVEVNGVYVTFKPELGKLVTTIYDYRLSISQDDLVELTEI